MQALWAQEWGASLLGKGKAPLGSLVPSPAMGLLVLGQTELQELISLGWWNGILPWLSVPLLLALLLPALLATVGGLAPAVTKCLCMGTGLRVLTYQLPCDICHTLETRDLSRLPSDGQPTSNDGQSISYKVLSFPAVILTS